MRTLTRLLSVILAAAGAVAIPAAASAAARCTVPTPSALSAFFDASVGDRLAATKVPGAVVSVVADGRTVFSRGYGTGMDPDRSLIRIASITKLFTWTAVLQQVTAGRLDLDADVNTYLTAFKVPATYPEPVTLRTLMNHTAGFEDRIIGTGARTAADVPPLDEYLASAMPDRIRPPGQVSAYSNYGAGLAGYIVSQVSGEPYDVYVQRHILDPLGMSHSTASEPVPAALAGDLARSYNTDEKPVYTVPFTFDVMPPDGSISATATDMTRFASAYLAGSLVPAAYTGRSFAADPRLGGYAFGFMDRTIGGHRVLMHDGSWEAFGSVLAMVPSCHLGIFVSANSTGSVDLLGPVMPDFFALLGPGSDPTPVPAATSPLTPSQPAAGFYEPARRSESTLEKILSLLGPSRLTIAADGTVHFRGKDFTPGADGLYAASDGSDHLVFLSSAAGARFAATDGPTLELMPWWRTPLFAFGLLVFVVLAALSAPVAVIRTRRRTAPGRRWRIARWSAAAASLVGLAFGVLVPVELFGNTRDLLFSVPLSFQLVLALPFLVAVLGAVGLAATVAGWRADGVRVRARVHQVVLLAGVAALLWFAATWNLIGT